MNQGSMLKPALIGGVLLGILSAIPVISALNCFCCAWVIGGGVLASYLYVNSSPVAVSLGKGVVLGLLTGVIGAIVDIVFTIPLQFLLSRAGMNPLQQVAEMLEQMPNMPPETKNALRSIFSHSAGAGLVLLIAGGFITLLLYSIMAMLGGAIGVAIFEKRKPGEVSDTAAGPYEPPTPPPPAR